MRGLSRRLPKTFPASTPYCIDLAVSVSRHPGACTARVRGLPVLFSYVALSGYRRPGLPEGCPGYRCYWLRGMDSNHRPSGYEPDELTAALPRKIWTQKTPLESRVSGAS